MEHGNTKGNIATKNNDSTNDIIAVRFRGNNKCYHFRKANINVSFGEAIVAMTEKGIDIGYVHYTPRKPDDTAKIVKILRRANEADLEMVRENVDLEIKARKIAQDEAKRLKLKMLFQVCKYSLDRKRATLYFTAENRVDFRELVKSLASKLQMRIELWQIGARDETRLFGGVGPCNRELCCASFYSSRQSVTVRDAKLQGLDINPQKITGMCGKLMCCLKFEVDDYREKMKNLPESGDIVKLGQDEVRVQKINPYTETVVVSFEDGSVKSFHASEIMVKGENGWSKVETETNKKVDDKKEDMLYSIPISNSVKDSNIEEEQQPSIKEKPSEDKPKDTNKETGSHHEKKDIHKPRQNKQQWKHSRRVKSHRDKQPDKNKNSQRKGRFNRDKNRVDITKSKGESTRSNTRKSASVKDISKYLNGKKKKLN